jgi:Beta/Gamma crystallin/Metallo-peptidase family M12B Reprolysin-like
MSVILYEHINFRGGHKHIIGRDEANLHSDGWGDRASSIQVSSGSWQFWQHVNFTGRQVTLGPGSYPWVVDAGFPNDTLSSVRRVAPQAGLWPTNGIVLYEHINFRGAHKHIIDRDEANLHIDGWGDRVSSIQVVSGRWRLFQHVDYGGWSTVLGPGLYPWVETVGIANDHLSSVRREEQAVNVPALQTREMILYEHIDFGGEHKHLINRGESSLHADGWGDRVSSFQVISGNRWTLHQHVNYAGSQIAPAPGSFRWIVDAGLANDSLSSVRANLLPIFVKTIQGAQGMTNNDLANANQVFGQYGIEVLQMGAETNNAPAVLDVTQPTCNMGQTPTVEEDQLFELERDHAPADIVVYYVRSTSLGLAGCAAFPANRPGVLVTDGASPWTMAHEIGHVLGLAHVGGNNNLMFTPTANITANPPVLTNTQLTTARASAFLV